MNEERPSRPAWYAIKTMDANFATLLRGLMVAASTLLATLMVVEVVLRYVIKAPFLGTEEVAVLLGLWLYALGMAYAGRQDAHISGGILAVLRLSAGTRQAFGVLRLVVCVIVGGVYAYYSFMYTHETFRSTQVSSYLHWPYGMWTASLLTGFVLMTLYFAVSVFKAWRTPPVDGG